MARRVSDEYYEDPGVWSEVPERYQVEVGRDLGLLVPSNTRSILDAGCGNGLITGVLPNDVPKYGVDGAFEALRRVVSPVCQGVLEKLPFADRAFDLVMSNDVLEHVADEGFDRCLEELFRVADRYVVVTTPFLEDLELGARRCSVCDHRFHVNRHVRSFGPEQVMALARSGWQLGIAVLSGAEWESEGVEVGRLRRALAVDGGDSCPVCGALSDALPADPDAEACCRVLSAMVSADALERGHYPPCRTEIISCFHRIGLGNPWQQWLTSTAEASLALDPHQLDFTSESIELFRTAHLPSAGARAYFHADASISSGAGLSLEVDQEVKVGFFALAGREVRIAGHASLRSMIQLQFHGAQGYWTVGTYTVQGEFDIEIPVDGGFVLGQFGRLLVVRCLAGAVFVRKVGLDVAGELQYLIPRVSLTTAFVPVPFEALPLALSARYYGTALPSPDAMAQQVHSRARAIRRAAGRSVESWFNAALHMLESYLSDASSIRQGMRDWLQKSAARSARIESRLHRIRGLERANQTLHDCIEGLERELGEQRAVGAVLGDRLRRVRIAERAIGFTRRIWDAARRPWRKRLPPPETGWRPRTAVMLVPDDRIDRRVLLEARSLVRAGWEVRVVGAPRPSPDYTHDEDKFPEVEILRVDTRRAQRIPETHAPPVVPDGEADWVDFYWLTNHFYLHAVDRPFQVVVAHDLPVLPAAAMAAARHGAYLVYDAHELYPEQHHFGEDLMARYGHGERCLAPLADQVITVNQSIATEMAQRYSITEPDVVLNCPDVDRDAVGRARDLRSALGIPTTSKILLFHGGLSLNRNLEALVAAMALVRRADVALVLMGPGEEKRLELEKIAEDAGTLGRQVFFHPAVDQDVLLEYVRGADAGVIPYPHIDLNSYYCTPNKLFDLLVCGVPILANDSPELRRFVHDQGVGMVHPFSDPVSIAAGIDAFFEMDHGAFIERLGEVGARFTWRHEGAKVVRLFEDLIASGRPAAQLER